MIDMVIAEDQAMLRDSLACAIDMQDDMHVVAAIADAADALSAVEKHHANLALLDVCTENDSSGTSLPPPSRRRTPTCAWSS